ncbi:hypothetical protein BN1723_019175, partial [Verticillium longisporum]
R